MSLYVAAGSCIADVTFGEGVFWRQVDTSKYSFFPSDIKTGINFKHLPYENSFFDCIVFDPPYMPTEKTGLDSFSQRYGIKRSFGKNKWYAAVLEDYFCGINESRRCLKNKGILVVKCQDMVCGGKQCLTHVDIVNYAASTEFVCEDIIVFMQQQARPHPRDKTGQKHARKNHSYFLIFRKKSIVQ